MSGMTNPPALELMADRDGERLDVFLARRLDDSSRSQVRRLIDDGLARVDGELERASYRLRFGEMVAVHEHNAAPLEAAVEIDLQVVYEDSQLAVIDKPAGLTVHPAPGEREATLIAALLATWPEIAALAEGESDALRPGLAHRLDRDTTGLLMVAKTGQALESLRDQLRERSIEKQYLTIVAGIPDPEAGLIDAPLGRDPADPRRMAVVERGRPAQTGYRITERFTDASVLECDLITGRTHQIRVHLARDRPPNRGRCHVRLRVSPNRTPGIARPLAGLRPPHQRRTDIAASRTPGGYQEAAGSAARGRATNRPRASSSAQPNKPAKQPPRPQATPHPAHPLAKAAPSPSFPRRETFAKVLVRPYSSFPRSLPPRRRGAGIHAGVSSGLGMPACLGMAGWSFANVSAGGNPEPPNFLGRPNPATYPNRPTASSPLPPLCGGRCRGATEGGPALPIQNLIAAMPTPFPSLPRLSRQSRRVQHRRQCSHRRDTRGKPRV